jgi:hypothetical protein
MRQPPWLFKRFQATRPVRATVQHLKGRLSTKAAKTDNNILTVLNVLLKKAVDWDVIDRMPCAVTLLPVPETSMSFSQRYMHLSPAALDAAIQLSDRRGTSVFSDQLSYASCPAELRMIRH